MAETPRKRRLSRFILAGLVFIVVLLCVLLVPTRHSIDREHFALVRPGMTEAEVEAIFGVPPGIYDGAAPNKNLAIQVLIPFSESMEDKFDPHQLAFSGRTMFISSRHGPHPYFKSWFSRGGAFYVAFDQHGRVAATGSMWARNTDPFWRRWWRQIAGG